MRYRFLQQPTNDPFPGKAPSRQNNRSRTILSSPNASFKKLVPFNGCWKNDGESPGNRFLIHVLHCETLHSKAFNFIQVQATQKAWNRRRRAGLFVETAHFLKCIKKNAESSLVFRDYGLWNDSLKLRTWTEFK